jgi:hypothetical protein
VASKAGGNLTANDDSDNVGTMDEFLRETSWDQLSLNPE